MLEHELKLDPPEAFELPALPGQPLEPRLFTSSYFDTPDQSLTRARITLRRRLENGVSRWQLKLPRGENADRDRGARRARRAPDRAARAAHGPPRARRVEPIATLRTRRVGVRVGDDGRQIADVTLDTVEILEKGRSAGGFAELEIELLDGDEDDLEQLGRVLRQAGAARSDGRLVSFRAAVARLRATQIEGDLRPLARRQFERLRKAAAALPADPADESLHALRIRRSGRGTPPSSSKGRSSAATSGR